MTAPPVAATAVYYGADYADVAADVAAVLGIPATQVLPAAGVAGVQVYLGSDFARDTDRGPAPRCPRTSSTRQPATPSASRRTRR